MAKLHAMLQAYEPSPGDPFDRVKAAHLLSRAGFGGTPDEVEHVLKLGPRDAVDWLLDFPDAGAEEQSREDVPDLSAIEGYPRTYRQIQQITRGLTPEERMAYRQKLQAANRQAVVATANWWLARMAAGPHPLQEKLTLFWHGHFTTSARDERSASLLWQQNELLRRQAAGNFREFVRNVSRDPAMLDYLNNSQNRKAHPNENYARELMELFTLGIGNYTEDDVKEAARAFTGWAHDGDDFLFRANQHDNDEKVFFGRRGNFDGDDVIDLILAHRACAPYVAGRLLRFFVREDAPPDVAAALGDVLREHRWELRPALRTMFTSRAFYAPEAIGTQIKSPVQLVVGTIRLLGLDMPPGRALTAALNQMGQVPLEPPNVKGWPGGRTWINTSTLFVRYNTAVWLAGGDGPGRGGGQRARGRLGGFDVSLGNGDGTSDDPAAVVDDWLARLVQRPVDETKKQYLVDAVGDVPTDESVKKVVQLIVSMPEYQLC
jgi:hypothetical protein